MRPSGTLVTSVTCHSRAVLHFSPDLLKTPETTPYNLAVTKQINTGKRGKSKRELSETFAIRVAFLR
jgi:hypothetical protein